MAVGRSTFSAAAGSALRFHGAQPVSVSFSKTGEIPERGTTKSVEPNHVTRFKRNGDFTVSGGT